MKRIAYILTAFLFLLCACQPTPEKEIVVNRADGTFEELIRITAAPQNEALVTPPADVAGATPRIEAPAAPTAKTTWDAQPIEWAESDDPMITKPSMSQAFPDHWEDTVETSYLPVKIDADIKTNGHPCPVRKVKKHTFTAEEVSRITEEILPQVTAVWNSLDIGKRQYARALQVITEQGMEDFAKQFYEQYRGGNLQEEDFVSTDHVSLGSDRGQTYLCEGNVFAEVWFTENKLLINRVKYAVPQAQESLKTIGYGDGEPVYVNPPITQEQAEETAYRFLERLGMEGYTICARDKAGYYETLTKKEHSQGWIFWLVKSDEYLPVEVTRHGLGSGLFNFSGEGQYSVPWSGEEMILYVDETGVSSLSWSYPVDTVEIINPDVELMTFINLKRQIKQMLRAGLSWMTSEYPFEAVVREMTLSEYIVPVKDELQSAYLIPAWICTVYLYNTNFPSNAPDTFYCIFNAIDGSPISNMSPQ